jgi:hypothetical protein
MTTTASAAEAHFRAVAPKYMALLLQDFPMLGVEDAAAVFGNAGHESKGLTDDQEDKPVVKGSRGGANWMQWTGPRRRALEAYCARNGLDPNSDEAAYKWLFLELKGAEKAAIPALLKAKTLKGKVEAFEKAFLRAGVKHYPSRLKWAEIALDAFSDTAGQVAAEEPVVETPELPSAPTPIPSRPAPAKPGWLHWAMILGVAAAVGAAVFFWGQGTLTEEVSLIGDDNRFGLLDGGGNLFAEIGLQIALSFLAPLVSAAAAAVVGWIAYQWQRVLKVEFDSKSASMLHASLERGLLAAIELFGSRAGKGKLLDFAADYAATNNPGAVRHFKLTDEKLRELAIPHLVTAKAATK